MTPAAFNVLSGDKPLTDPEHDRLGYAPFAAHLAESILHMVPTEGLVIALYGPWGSGKTTVLNFILHYLQRAPKTEQPIIVRFNPWWFSGHEDLTRRFFGQLLAILSKWKSIGNDVRKSIADFAELVSAAPIPYASSPLKVGGRMLRPRQKDVPELKTEVSDALQKHKRRILVVIDDIDRLTADEIKQLFRVIKAVADFPNVLYLLAFDKKVAIEAVQDMQGIPGEAYLDKIVQVPFELPLPDKTLLRGLLFERLDVILSDTPNELFDRTYWSNVYFEGIDHFIVTPRDIVRLTNTLGVTYANPEVKANVNPVDFIAIETLRVFSPQVYEVIRKSPDVFTGHTGSSGLRASRTEDFKPFLDSMMEGIEEESREPLKRLLVRLFPRIEAIWGMMKIHYGPEMLSTWRKQLRVCSPEIFSTYFRLAVPEGSITNAEMQVILALAGDANTFAGKLVELSSQKRPEGTTRVGAFLERLEDYTGEDIPIEHIPSILEALFDMGDDLLRPEDERAGIFEFGNDIRIGRIVFQLLRRLDEQARFETLKEAISKGRAVATIVGEVAVFGQEHGRYGEVGSHPAEERLVSAQQQLDELEKLALEKIRYAAQRNALLKAPRLPSILYRWRDWAGEEEPKQWVQKAIEDEEGLVALLERFLQRTFVQSAADVVGRTGYRLDPQQIQPFVEPSQIIDRARSLAESNELMESQRIAITQYLQEYDIWEQANELRDT